MWLKLCGIVRPEDLAFAVSLEADAVGIIAVRDSPRRVSEREAVALSGVPRGDTKVVLAVRNPDPSYLELMIEIVQPDLLQFQGSESPEMAMSIGLPYIKAVRKVNFESAWNVRKHKDAFAWLLDAPGLNPENMALVGKLGSIYAGRRLIVGGELRAETVADVIRNVPVWGVEVTQAVERSPREKDHELMRRFVNVARALQTT